MIEVYISWFEYQQRTIWNIYFILTTFLYKSEDEMSSPSHTCICLQIINWLSYLHTNTAQMLQTWQYNFKSSKEKEFNAQAILKYTTFISKFSEKKIDECDNFFHCDTNTYISLILLLMQIIVIIRGKNTTKQQIIK